MTRQHASRSWRLLAATALVGALVAACAGSSADRRAKPVAGGRDAPPGIAQQASAARGAPPSAAQPSDASVQPSDAAKQGRAPEGAGPAETLPSLLDRKIVRVATISITTGAVPRAFEDVGNIATAEGGFIASSSFGNSGDRQTASVTIRVPAERYHDTLVQLRKLGEVKDESSNANDVSEEYTDLNSRLRNLQVTEQQYLAFLAKANDIPSVLQIQDRLSAVRAQIEQVQGRINLLDHQSDLATITVHLDPPLPAKPKTEPKGSGGVLDVARDAFHASITVLLGVATVAVAVGAFSWWLLPLAIAGYAIARRSLRASRERRAPPPASTV